VSTRQRLGDVLLERELVTREQLDEALACHRASGGRLGEVLVSMGAITQEQLSWALSEAFHIPFVDLSDEVVDLEVARSLPEAVLRRHEAVPILRAADEMTVLVADPTNKQAAIELEALSGSRVTLALAAREAVLHFLDRAFPDSSYSAGQQLAGAKGRTSQVTDLTGVSQVFALLLGAVRDQATELHLEPAPNGVLIRVRVDGRLLDRAWFDRELLAPITFRLRVLAGLRGEPAPRLARVRTRLDGRDVGLELFFFPTVGGEAVTVRFHPATTEAPTLETLGAPAPAHRLLLEFAAGARGPDGPGGLVVVAGPDVGARAEILYALAQAAAGPGQRVVTLERRVSFVVPGFLQVELPTDFGTEAAAILSRPGEVTLVEDMATANLSAAALASADQGTLVLAGIALGSMRSALAYLASADLRGPLLALTRGIVDVRRRRDALTIEALSLTPALRRDLVERKDSWTSPSF
jgi:type II secretory ATPase GspE/PulE/Tfp pilus assembly ATPase PilB-like protein